MKRDTWTGEYRARKPKNAPGPRSMQKAEEGINQDPDEADLILINPHEKAGRLEGAAKATQREAGRLKEDGRQEGTTETRKAYKTDQRL